MRRMATGVLAASWLAAMSAWGAPVPVTGTIEAVEGASVRVRTASGTMEVGRDELERQLGSAPRAGESVRLHYRVILERAERSRGGDRAGQAAEPASELEVPGQRVMDDRAFFNAKADLPAREAPQGVPAA